MGCAQGLAKMQRYMPSPCSDADSILHVLHMACAHATMPSIKASHMSGRLVYCGVWLIKHMLEDPWNIKTKFLPCDHFGSGCIHCSLLRFASLAAHKWIAPALKQLEIGLHNDGLIGCVYTYVFCKALGVRPQLTCHESLMPTSSYLVEPPELEVLGMVYL